DQGHAIESLRPRLESRQTSPPGSLSARSLVEQAQAASQQEQNFWQNRAELRRLVLERSPVPAAATSPSNRSGLRWPNERDSACFAGCGAGGSVARMTIRPNKALETVFSTGAPRDAPGPVIHSRSTRPHGNQRCCSPFAQAGSLLRGWHGGPDAWL